MTGSTHGSVSQEWSEQRRFSAAMLAVGLVVGFVGMYFMVVRPLKGRMDLVESRLHSVDREMDDLVGSQDDVWKTNNLLSSLKSQKMAIDSARDAVKTIRQFRSEIESEATRTRSAVSALEEIAALQQSVIGQQEKTAAAENALASISSLQQSVIKTNAQTAKANAAIGLLGKLQKDAITASLDSDESQARLTHLVELQKSAVTQAQGTLDQLVAFKDRAAKRADGIDDVHTKLDGLMAVKDRINSEAKSVARAKAGLAEFVDLKDNLIQESDDILAAQDFTLQLLSMKDELALRGSDVATTQQKATQLLALNDKVSAAAKMDVADKNLDELFGLQNKLLDRTSQVADAVETLELFADFQRQFDDHVASLDGMRRTLVEILTMEHSFKRAMQVLQPIVELSNLRNLSSEEVRSAARSILDKRQSRIASRRTIISTPLNDAIVPVSDQTASGQAEKLVPTPIDPVIDAEEIDTK